jgi:large subunit ribosomal protein LP1
LAALVLYDGEAEITSDNINTLLNESNNKVAPYWPALFAGMLKGGRIENFVFSLGGGGAAPAAVVAEAAPAAGGGEKKEEKKKEEVVDVLDGGMDMFGGGGGGGGDY